MLKAPPEDVTREFHIVGSEDEKTKGSISQAQQEGGSEPARDVAVGTDTSFTGIPDLRVNAPYPDAPTAGSAAMTAPTEEPRVLIFEPPESPRAVETSQPQRQRRWKVVGIVVLSVLLLASVIINIVLAVKQSNDNGPKGSAESAANGPRSNPLYTQTERIGERGYMVCGVVEHPGLGILDSVTGNWSGFEIDLCRAIGAAIFREDGHVRFTTTNYQDRFNLLQSGQVDLLATRTTYTMERDLYEPTAKSGFSFSVPYLYNGVSFAGDPKFVACAEQGLTTATKEAVPNLATWWPSLDWTSGLWPTSPRECEMNQQSVRIFTFHICLPRGIEQLVVGTKLARKQAVSNQTHFRVPWTCNLQFLVRVQCVDFSVAYPNSRVHGQLKGLFQATVQSPPCRVAHVVHFSWTQDITVTRIMGQLSGTNVVANAGFVVQSCMVTLFLSSLSYPNSKSD